MTPRNMVADAIRDFRHRYKLTQVELARKAGIPRATLALMESPRGNPSVASVAQVAEALGVPVGDLLGRPTEAKVTLVASEDMPETRMDGGKMIARLLSPALLPNMQFYKVVLTPGCSSKGRPHPKGSTEYLYCIEGEGVVLVVHESEVLVKPGELASFPGNAPHLYTNPGSGNVEAYVLVASVGS